MVNKYLKRKQNGGEAPVEPKKDSPYEKAVSFEVTREELFLASERKAWRYTVLLGVLSNSTYALDAAQTNTAFRH